MNKRVILHRHRYGFPTDFSSFVPPPDVPIEQLWTPDAVLGRMMEAIKTVERTGKRVAPKQYGSAMPAYQWDWADLVGHEAPERSSAPFRTTSRVMTRVEDAIEWPMRYLKTHPGPARVLHLFLRCRVRRQNFGAACKARGWSRATAYRGRDRALSLIAMGLISDRVPLRLGSGADEDDLETAD